MALLREAKRQSLNARFLGGDGWTGVVADTAAAEGAYVGAPFTDADTRPDVRRFVQSFLAKYLGDALVLPARLSPGFETVLTRGEIIVIYALLAAVVALVAGGFRSVPLEE